MSAILSWASSGLGAKTGTAIGNLFADMVTLITSKSGDATFKWQVASSNTGSTPYQITLKPKAGGAGRILLVAWSSAPAGNNSAILDVAPSTSNLYGAFFPAGNVDTPSNLTASSGTVMGDDTGAVKVWAAMPISTIYGASIQPFYFDSDEAVAFGFQNPASGTAYFAAAGAIVVDDADNAYSAVASFANNSASGYGSSLGLMGWSSSATTAGSATPCVRTNYGAANRVYFHGLVPLGTWGATAPGPTDILTDTTNSDAWFYPLPLLGQAKGGGFALKWRQIGMGPGTSGPLTPYNSTGPVVAARQFNAATAGGNGYPWLTNFKI